MKRGEIHVESVNSVKLLARRDFIRSSGVTLALLCSPGVGSVHARAEFPPLPPVVQVTPPKVVIGESVVSLEGVAFDPAGEAKKFPVERVWTQVSGPNTAVIEKPSAAVSAVRQLVPGRYVFLLTAKTLGGRVSSAETVVTVRPGLPGSAFEADDRRLQVIGRSYAPSSKMIEFGWGGVTLKAHFTGTSVRALLKSGWGPPPKLFAIVDGREDAALRVDVDARGDYLLAEHLSPGEHVLELVRATGAWNAAVEFRGLVLDPGATLLAPPLRASRRIEFYGDSITEGSYMSDQPFTNARAAYALTTARLLGAEAHLIAKGGIGLLRGYALPQTLPGIYDRAVPMRADQKWDFTRWTPQVVVINVFQNDKWTQAKMPAEAFISAYAAFLKTLRSHYPCAHFVAALGSMDAVEPKSLWLGYLREAVARFQSETGDKRIDVFLFDYLGAKGHPNAAQARVMAERLAAFLVSKGDRLWQSEPL
jgi:lysophospholipase L1-like esterase